jgi:HEPN domain-containing protein
MKKQAESWLQAAKDNLNVIKEILENNELTNMVAFHAQQLIEKSFKAILEEYKGQVPKMHSIITLKEQIKEFINIPVNQDIFDQLNELYIDSRYPSEIGLLPNGKPSKKEAKIFFKEANEIFQKISEKLKKEPA